MRRIVMKKLIVMCALVMAIVGTANAAPTTLITFDEFPLGTMVDDEYAGCRKSA
jgi:hypothetical protein